MCVYLAFETKGLFANNDQRKLLYFILYNNKFSHFDFMPNF